MQDSHKQGRSKLRNKDTLKSNLKWNGISPHKLEATATDRSAWRSLISQAAAAFEEDRQQRLAAARDRHHKAESASIQTKDYHCDTCGHMCASRSGLQSHTCSHRWENRLCHRLTPMDYQQNINDQHSPEHGPEQLPHNCRYTSLALHSELFAALWSLDIGW